MKLGITLIAVLTYFLFASGPNNYDSILYRSLWDGGHFVLFAAIVFVLTKLSFIKNKSWYVIALAVAPFCVILGFSTEFLQLLVGRSFQYADVVNDVIGGYAGFLLSRLTLSFSSEPSNHLTKNQLSLKRVGFVVSLLILSLAGFREFLYTSVHVWNMKLDFPVLADFEAPLELDRWEHNRVSITKSSLVVRNDEFSLKAVFHPAKYPGIVLRRLIHNWNKFNYLNLSINNPSDNVININLKIYDSTHTFRNYRYNDRYNKNLTLNPGWNDIRIPIEEIRNSPEYRKMNMKQIYLINLFMIRIEEETTVYIDDIFLSS